MLHLPLPLSFSILPLPISCSISLRLLLHLPLRLVLPLPVGASSPLPPSLSPDLVQPAAPAFTSSPTDYRRNSRRDSLTKFQIFQQLANENLTTPAAPSSVRITETRVHLLKKFTLKQGQEILQLLQEPRYWHLYQILEKI
ncbi:uncharacterized protein LOC131221303 [Magnolia sinica]|uniref:uncharacterized protein LOC131221303 n=1 Tax=Magnolia sinica TaxID=86752 RepID=UPI002657DA69|nr:uncharacterized protein LOC131221303 [Magnolia sinica]